MLRNNKLKTKPFVANWQKKAEDGLGARDEEAATPLNPILAALNLSQPDQSKEEPLINHSSSNNQDSSVPATGLNDSRYSQSSSSSSDNEGGKGSGGILTSE